MAQATERAQPLTRQADETDRDFAEIIDGLSRPQKTLSPKFFYDERGSQLFDAICELPEYYPTRTELAILEDNIEDICRAVGPKASLIEFGSGSSLKTRVLLEHLPELAAYVPVDISEDFLVASANALAEDFPHVEIMPVAADFTRPFDLPSPRVMPERNLVFFPGSTIGNFLPDAAVALLDVMRQEAKEGGALLIGVDLKKDRATLERAYNDAAGVTADFNLNMLRRLNREFGADFDLDAFRHRAVYNEPLGRIEMHLVSARAQTVTIDGASFDFEEGEWILSETSHKYSLEDFAQVARQGGFEVAKVWTDPARLFSVQYCESI